MVSTRTDTQIHNTLLGMPQHPVEIHMEDLIPDSIVNAVCVTSEADETVTYHISCIDITDATKNLAKGMNQRWTKWATIKSKHYDDIIEHLDRTVFSSIRNMDTITPDKMPLLLEILARENFKSNTEYLTMLAEKLQANDQHFAATRINLTPVAPKAPKIRLKAERPSGKLPKEFLSKRGNRPKNEYIIKDPNAPPKVKASPAKKPKVHDPNAPPKVKARPAKKPKVHDPNAPPKVRAKPGQRPATHNARQAALIASHNAMLREELIPSEG